MFSQILDQVTTQTNRKYQGRKFDFNDYLIVAIRVWCNQLDISQEISNYIITGYQPYEFTKLTDFIWQESQAKCKKIKIPNDPKTYAIDNQFYYDVDALLSRLNIRNGTMKFIVLIAFGITAIGFWLYIINRGRQQQTSRREELRQYNSNPPSFTDQTPTVQASTNQFLVLVVSASKADFLELLKSKGCINVNDGEELYKITKYLWLGDETKTDFNQKKVNIKRRHEVLKGQESEEYDIYLMYIELKQSQAGEGFKKDVSQLDRHEAFRKFDNLVEDFEISPRLQMEAYENFEVYNR